MADSKKTLKVTVKGRVQGVFFRATTKRVADTLGVRGFVKNEPEGSVYLEVEGDDEMVNKVIDFCHHGPDGAMVENVSITLGVWVGYKSFEIRD